MYLRFFLIGLLGIVLFAPDIFAQVTLHVVVPANTPNAAPLYLAGNFNDWTNNSPIYQLTPHNSGATYSITFTPPIGSVAFKITRGSWTSVEGNANGFYIPDHVFTYTGSPTHYNLPILSWEDLGVSSSNTAFSNVIVESNNFYIPQLNRNRRVQIYLPPNYYSATDRYFPVLYAQDGQNLFDLAQSFAGEWEIDESINAQTAGTNGNYGCIVVAIDNGGAHRIDEYSPWVNPSYGGGEGDEYADFIVNTLKPYIDTNYRTLPCRNHTGIAGSSMGGLFALYAAIAHQDVFGKAGIFSPSLWFSSQVYSFVQAIGKQQDMKIYFVAGTDESSSMLPDMAAMYNQLLAAGFSTDELSYHAVTGGQHSEWFWAQEFPNCYQWLYNIAPTYPLQPVIIATNNSHEACAADVVTYSVNAVAGSTYTWTVTGGTILSGGGLHDTDITIQWNNSGAGLVSVTQAQ